MSADELAAVRNTRLFEVFNGHPQVNNAGGGGVPGLEDAWDAISLEDICSTGSRWMTRIRSSSLGTPMCPALVAAGWWSARPDSRLEPSSKRLSKGFLCLDRCGARGSERTSERITLTVKATSYSKYACNSSAAVVEFFCVITPRASYTFQGQERYVRAKVIESNGRVAWMQPVTVGPSSGGYASLLAFMAFALGAVVRWRSFGRAPASPEDRAR